MPESWSQLYFLLPCGDSLQTRRHTAYTESLAHFRGFFPAEAYTGPPTQLSQAATLSLAVTPAKHNIVLTGIAKEMDQERL